LPGNSLYLSDPGISIRAAASTASVASVASVVFSAGAVDSVVLARPKPSGRLSVLGNQL